MTNIITTSTKQAFKQTLHMIGLMVVILSFLAVNPRKSWSDEQLLQDIGESVFMIKINGENKAAGFVIDKDILVTNYDNTEVQESVLGRGGLDVLRIESSTGEQFSIEGVIGIHLLSDLVFLKIEDYEGPWLELGDFVEVNKNESIESYHIVGFSFERLQIINNLIKSKDIGSMIQLFYYSYDGIPFEAVGLPIINNMGEVVAVTRFVNDNRIFGIRKEILQDFLYKTQHQKVIFNDETIHSGWTQQEREKLKILALQGDADAQFALGQRFYDSGNTGQAKYWWTQASLQGYRKAQKKLLQFKTKKFLLNGGLIGYFLQSKSTSR